jgi:hypothetical protein
MLKLQYALLAEHQREGQRGTYDLLGVFDRVFASSLPAQHARMVFVVQLVTMSEDDLGKHSMRMIAKAPSGRVITEVRGDMHIKAEGGTWLGSGRLNFQMEGFPMMEYGRHAFIIEIDGKHVADHFLSVVPAPKT